MDNPCLTDSDSFGNLSKVYETLSIYRSYPNVKQAAIMPDACYSGANSLSVGGVIAVENAIIPSAHSADICCSVATTVINDKSINLKSILDAAQAITHFGAGGRTDDRFSHEFAMFEEAFQNNRYLKGSKVLSKGMYHLGTQGDGNHFLYVGSLKMKGHAKLPTITTHHGSRGVGAELYKIGIKISETFRKNFAPSVPKNMCWIPFDSPEGKEYWDALILVRTWTKFNHMVLHEAIEDYLEIEDSDFSWNPHNFVFKRGNMFYHAKGSTPIDTDFEVECDDPHLTDRRYVPLNMSEPILILEAGTGNHFGFAPHGAGRLISRSEHKRRLNEKGITEEEAYLEETEGIDARFVGKPDCSELPSAYKNANQVIKDIDKYKLGNLIGTIEPYGCIMAGHQPKPWLKKKI